MALARQHVTMSRTKADRGCLLSLQTSHDESRAAFRGILPENEGCLFVASSEDLGKSELHAMANGRKLHESLTEAKGLMKSISF